MIELTDGTESNADCISFLMYYFCLKKKYKENLCNIKHFFEIFGHLDIVTSLHKWYFINRKTSCISLINFSEVIHEVHRFKHKS